MPREILFPTHLDALIVAPGETSPTADLASASLFQSGRTLGAGIHLHWALPDALTEGEAAAEAHAVDLPAVPDRWLVVRIAPPTSATAPRATTAWIVDAGAPTPTPTPLASWSPTTPAPTSQRLTVLGRFAGGRAPVGDGVPEALATDCVYYPRAVNRFGFHDPLTGVGPGRVSYLVVGWYADSAHDPLRTMATAQAAWLEARRCVIDDAAAAAAAVTPPIGTAAASPAQPSTTTGGRLGALAAAFRRIDAVPGAAMAGGWLPAALRDLLPGGAIGGMLPALLASDRLICHGALTDLPWRQPGPSLPPEPPGGVRLYGSLREAGERYFADLAENEAQRTWLAGAMIAAFGRAGGHSASFLDASWQGHVAGFIGHLGESATAPRYHAPDAPAVIVEGLPRSLRHGEDADLDPERTATRPGRVRLRTTTVTALRTVVGDRQLTVNAAGLAQPLPAAGLPALTDELLDEAMLLDRSNLEAIAARIEAQGVAAAAARSAAVEAIAAWQQLASPDRAAQARPYFVGRPPMPFAVKSHWPTRLPLYVELTGEVASDTEGASRIPDDWALGTIDLERKPGTTPTPGPTRPFAVRRALTPVLARMLASVTHDDVLRSARLLACTLPEVDRALAGGAVRTGTLRITRLRVIDTFGQSYPLVGHDGPLAVGGPALELTPRLTGWARIHARLLDRADQTRDAGEDRPPVCGFVLADRVDHALEVFDHRGARIGQLRHLGSGAGATVAWEPDPQRAVVSAARAIGEPERVLAAADPDGPLLAIVRGLMTAQVTHGVVGGDTSLSALIGALDALQATAARAALTDELGPLLGRPLAVVRLATRLERVAPAASDPRTGPRAAGTLSVPLAFGAVILTEDGTFGGFTDGDFAHFRPVDGDAIAPATTAEVAAPTLHPYLLRTPVVAADEQPRITTLLVDPRLSIHVRTGVLPAKRIAMTPAMYQPALTDLAPTIRVGPVLLPPARPWLPAPYLPGSTWRWLHAAPPAPGQAAGALVDEALTPPGAGAGLPEDVAVAAEGWLRRVPTPRT